MPKFLVPRDARSWVDVRADSHFPIQNLPFGVAHPKGGSESLAVAIGAEALLLQPLGEAGMISMDDFPGLDSFLDLDQESLSALRSVVYELLASENSKLRDNSRLRDQILIPQRSARMQVPIPPTSFVDFYSGIHHASNVGRMFRPDQAPLLPNYRHLPVAYNGRASSVVGSGTDIRRPKGQTKPADSDLPHFGPTLEMDFELELGCYISHGQEMGKRITCSAAEDHILGVVIVNDWSARDIQRWEYQPLGPFLAKSFGTTVSPWIVTLDALEGCRIQGCVQEPEVLPHLRRKGKQHFDIHLEVWLKSAEMTKPQRISTSNTSNLYWSFAQQIAHLTSNGCPVEPADLIATGTISGPERHESGSMLELSWRGSEPLVLEESGENRTFLADGDTLTLTGWVEGEGVKIGFGECTGTIRPAV